MRVTTIQSQRRLCGVILAILLFVSSYVGAAETNAKYWIFLGTSTEATTPEMDKNGIQRSEGIYVGKYDASTGAISDVRLALKAPSSGYIATLPDRNLLYFVGSAKPSDRGSNAYACKVDPKTGDLTLLNGVSTQGSGVCHTFVRPDGKFLTAANYMSGDFSVFKLKGDGLIEGVTAKYRNGVCRLFMSDLGSDRIYIARLNEENGSLEEDPRIPFLATPAGAGPRHLSFATDANGKTVVFSINELDSTLSAFRLDFESGTSALLGTWSTLEEEFRKGLTDEETIVDGKTFLYGNKTAAIEVAKLDNGKTVVYATNRGQNTIVSFDATDIIAGKIDVEFPLIQRISSYGNFPRYMSLDPVGKRLIVSNKKSGSVFVYTIDQETGKLSLSQEKPTQIAWVIAAGFIPRED